jgi:hypothetical protein
VVFSSESVSANEKDVLGALMIILFVSVILFTVGNFLRKFKEMIIAYTKGRSTSVHLKKQLQNQELLREVAEKLMDESYSVTLGSRAEPIEIGTMNPMIGAEQISPTQLRDFNLFIQRVDEQSRRMILDNFNRHPLVMRSIISVSEEVISEYFHETQDLAQTQLVQVQTKAENTTAF